MLDRFAREYQEYHRISPGRRTEQLKVIAALGEHASKEPHECDASDLKQYLSGLLDGGLHVNTVRKKLHMLVPFFGWAWEAGLIEADRLMAIQRISDPRGSSSQGLPRPYSRKELDRFRADLAARWPEVDAKWWVRWRRGTSRFKRIQTHTMRIQIEAIVALALYCGLRSHEIFMASLDDIHYDNAYVVVRHGKDASEREVPHTEASREAVRRWIELRAELAPDHDSPWLSLAWEDVARLPMRWDRYRKLLTTVGDWQLHRFRHTAGTEWLRATKRLEIVQKLLGHATLQQTLGYAKIVRDDLHDAIAKAELKFEEQVAA